MRHLFEQFFITPVINNLINNLVLYSVKMLKNIYIKCNIILILFIYNLYLSYYVLNILTIRIQFIKAVQIYSWRDVFPLLHNNKPIHLTAIILNHMINSNITTFSSYIPCIHLNIFHKFLILHIPFPFKCFLSPCARNLINVLYK